MMVRKQNHNMNKGEDADQDADGPSSTTAPNELNAAEVLVAASLGGVVAASAVYPIQRAVIPVSQWALSAPVATPGAIPSFTACVSRFLPACIATAVTYEFVARALREKNRVNNQTINGASSPLLLRNNNTNHEEDEEALKQNIQQHEHLYQQSLHQTQAASTQVPDSATPGQPSFTPEPAVERTLPLSPPPSTTATATASASAAATAAGTGTPTRPRSFLSGISGMFGIQSLVSRTSALLRRLGMNVSHEEIVQLHQSIPVAHIEQTIQEVTSNLLLSNAPLGDDAAPHTPNMLPSAAASTSANSLISRSRSHPELSNLRNNNTTITNTANSNNRPFYASRPAGANGFPPANSSGLNSSFTRPSSSSSSTGHKEDPDLSRLDPW